jgi:hypothetical protein
MHTINKEQTARCDYSFLCFKILQVYIPCRVGILQTVHSKTQTYLKRLDSTHAVCTFLPKAVALTTVRTPGAATLLYFFLHLAITRLMSSSMAACLPGCEAWN